MLAAWILLIVFSLIDLFLSLLRAALFNARLPQLIDQGTADKERLEKTIRILEKSRLRATMRVLTALTHVLVLACAWQLFSLIHLEIRFGGLIGIFAGILLILIALEFLVERFPLKDPEGWALTLAPAANLLDLVFGPLVSFFIRLQGTQDVIQRNLGSVSEDELKTWVEVGEPQGGLEPDERKMIYSIFQFGDTLCREIMVPRTEVLALDVKTPLSTAINLFVESGHSRVPVYEEVIDNVIGLLYAKDLLRQQSSSADHPSIREFLRPAYFVPESKKVDDLLAEMQSKGIHMAVVVDEYGGMAGLVTLEDIVEEIVGEIRDEFDQSEVRLVQKISQDEYLFMGRVSLDDFNDALETDLVSEQSDTLGGYFLNQMGRVPMEGDQLNVGGWKLTVEEVRGRRIGRIRAVRIEEPSEVEREEERD